jgi:hypothetical protein
MFRKDVKERVKVFIDELTPFSESELTLDSDTLTKPIDSYIDGLLDEATDDVKMIAPLNRIRKYNLNSSLSEETLHDGTVYYTVELPADFLRIATISMTNWHRAVYSSTSKDGEGYKLLRNPHTTAGASKPVIIINGNYLELYGSKISGVEMKDKEYIKKEYFSDEVDYTVDSLLLDAICWRCAVLVLGIMGRKDVLDKAQEFYNQSLIILS